MSNQPQSQRPAARPHESAPEQEARPPGEAALDTEAKQPSNDDLRCTLCGMRACWTR